MPGSLRSPARPRPSAGGGRAGVAALLALILTAPLAAAAQQQPPPPRKTPAGQPRPAPRGAPAGAARRTPPPARGVTLTRSAWSFEASARAEVGYDTNVFQTDSAVGDAYSRLGGWASAAREGQRSRLSGRLEVNRKLYNRFSRADETEGFLDLGTSHDLGRLLAGVTFNSSYLDLRLLDREGNLLPRSTFASLSNRLQGYVDLALTKTLYLGVDAAYRLKNYEETAGLPSLDYGAWSTDVGLTRYFPARFSIRLQGTWEERAYRKRQAADATGFLDPDNPELRLRRLEGEARVRKRWGKEGVLQGAFALRRSDDLFQDELSYDQRSASLRFRHTLPRWAVGMRAGWTNRDFELRRSGAGEPLEERYITFAADLERALWSGARAIGGYELLRRSANDVFGDFTVGTVRLGVVHAF